MSVVRTTCKIGACEPFCGMEVEVRDGRMIAVHPDAGHPVTEGYSCIKSLDLYDAARVTGIARAQIERLADEFAAAESAFASSRVGVQTSHNSTLTEWAVMTLNVLTGNIDRPGGVYFNPGVFDGPGLIEKFTRRRNSSPSRVGRYPQIFGGPPAAVLADDVLSEDPDRIRALVVVAGNPVITFPNTAKVEAALKRLELLVCIDIYLSDTATFAHYVLPATTMYEKGTLHFLTSNFEPYPFVEWKPKVVEPRSEAKTGWDTFKCLSRAARVRFLNDPLLDKSGRLLDWVGLGFDEDLLYRYLLLGKVRLGRLRKIPGGMKFGDVRWGEFLESGLRTSDKKVHLAPAEFVDALPQALHDLPRTSSEFPLLLISGARRSAGYNSWTHNVPALMEKMKGNWATLNPADAARIGVSNGQRVHVSSRVGSLEIHADLHLTDLERGPLPRRARTCRGMLEAGRDMCAFRGLRPPQKCCDINVAYAALSSRLYSDGAALPLPLANRQIDVRQAPNSIAEPVIACLTAARSLAVGLVVPSAQGAGHCYHVTRRIGDDDVGKVLVSRLPGVGERPLRRCARNAVQAARPGPVVGVETSARRIGLDAGVVGA